MLRRLITYTGRRNEAGTEVTVEVEVLEGAELKVQPLPTRTDLINHSPTGFEWGYWGSGPAQLALAILCHWYGDAVAQVLYQQFKEDLVAHWGRENGASWALHGDEIDLWLRTKVGGATPAPKPAKIPEGELNALVRKLWDQAVGRPGYEKEQWARLEALIGARR